MAALLAAVSAIVFAALPAKRLLLATSTPAPGPTVIAGASHIHTARSDGTGTPDEIAAAAARVGLHFIILTDHGDGTRAPDAPQYRHGVLCLDAVEVSTDDGHYIGVGIPQAPYPLGGEARDVVEDVKRLGGFGIVAHPDSNKDELRWREWTAPFEAMEWLNGDTEWRDEASRSLTKALITYPFRPVESLASLIDRPSTTLSRWDALTQRRAVVGLPGSDAHARLAVGGDARDPYRNRVLLRLPGYETVFSAFSMRVELDRPFSGDAAVDSTSLLAALRGGRLYTVVDGLAGPPQFEFIVRSGSRQARQGESLQPDGPLRIEIRSNAPADSFIALFRDGRLIADQSGSELRRELPAARGVLRVEIRLNRRGGGQPASWIVSNPIYVSPLPARVAPAPSATETRPLSDSAASRWHIEPVAGSKGDFELAGEGSVRVSYALTPQTDAQSLALVMPEGAVLREYDRISFRGRADKPMRLSVQLRKPGDVEGQRWRRSVYLDQTPRDVTVLFRDMTPMGQTDRYRPDLLEVEDLLFVVGTANTAPGTSGTYSIDGLRLER